MILVPLLGLVLLGAGVWLWRNEEAATRDGRSVELPLRAPTPGERLAEPPTELLPAVEPERPGASEPGESYRLRASEPVQTADEGLVAGAVRWPDGTPARAQVLLVAAAGGELWLETVSDARDGRFRFPAPDEPWELLASAARTLQTAPSSVELLDWRARSGPRLGAAHGLELVLDPGLRLTGSIRDRSDRPLRGSVFATLEGGRFPEHGDLASVGSDDSGTFLLLGLRAGRWTLRAQAGDHLSEERTLELPSAEPVVFRLERGSSLAGRVVDELGEPVPGAVVAAHHFDGQGGMARTSADGSFAIRELSPGTLRVLTTREGERHTARMELTLEPGQERGGIEIVLARAGTVEVLVRDTRGRGIVAADVRLSSERGDAFFARTGPEGFALFEGLAPGDYTLAADLPSRMRLAGDAVVQAYETTRVELVEPVTVLRVHGRVRVDGVPRGALELEARRVDTRASVGSASTAPDGSYALELVESGEHWIGVRDPARRLVDWRRVLVPDVALFPLDLELSLGRLHGLVWSPEGEPLEGIEVLAVADSEDGMRRSSGAAFSDERGEFTLELVAGVHVLEARTSAQAEGARAFAPTRVPGVVVRAGEVVTGIELTLERGARLEGVVRRRDRTGVYGAHLWLATPGSQERPRKLGTSGTLGRFRLEGLPLGTWLVTASDGERQAAWREVTIGAGTVATLELVLE